MKKEFILPNFNQLKTYNINNSIEKVKKSKLYDPSFEAKPPIDKYIKVIDKLKNNEKLYKRDYKTLIYYMDKVEKEGYFEKFYVSFVTNINSFKSVGTLVRPFLNCIYNYYDKSENLAKVYNIFRVLRKILPKKVKYHEIYNKLELSNDMNEYLGNIQFGFSNIQSEKDIEDYCKIIFMKNTDRYFDECIKEFIIKKYLDDELWTFFRQTIEKMNLSIQKDLFREILLKYKYNYNIETYPVNWFRLIQKELKDPYDPSNQRWHGIEDDVKEIFRRWNVHTNLYDFFEKRVVGGDRRRLEFWKQYINNVYRIEYFPNVNNALVMEFRNHVFIEFAEINNALYVYNKNRMDMEVIKGQINKSTLSNSQKIRMLKDKGLVLKWMAHSGEWERRFSHYIMELGYQKSRW